MLTASQEKINFDFDKCQQCGACMPVCPTKAIALNLRKDGMYDVAIDRNACIMCKKCVATCPANKPQDFSGYSERALEAKFSLGYNTDKEIRRQASSGAVARTIIIESLRNNIVDGAYAVVTDNAFPYAKGAFFTKDNIPSYRDMPNSVYHCVPACSNLDQAQKCDRLLILGTACQLRALTSALKGKAKRIYKVCIFCKQQKSLGSTLFLAKAAGVKTKDPLSFSATYRGDGWPGLVTINGKSIPWHRAAQLPFGRKLWTVPGCNICGDPFGIGIGADISLMDPWSIRQRNDLGETLISTFTEDGLSLINSIPNLKREALDSNEAIKALDLTDIRRKQALVPYYGNMPCSKKIRFIGWCDKTARKSLQRFLTVLPKMPWLFYRALCKLPDPRKLI